MLQACIKLNVEIRGPAPLGKDWWIGVWFKKQPRKFSGIDIYYNYAFDLGHPVNPIDAARSLLKTEVAQAFRNPLTGSDELAQRYKYSMKTLAKLTHVAAEMAAWNDQPNMVDYLKLLRYFPVRLGKAYLQAFKAAFFTRSSQPLAMASQITQQQSSDPMRVAAQIVGELVKLLALHEDADRQIYFSGYLESLPFVRIGLQPFYTKMAGKSTAFDVTLTIHRAGIAILTAYGIFAGTMTAEELRDLHHFSQALQECELLESALQRYFASLDEAASSVAQMKADVLPSSRKGYIKLTEDKFSLKLGSVFDVYRYFIIEVIHDKHYSSLSQLLGSLRSRTWHAYPIIFIKHTRPGYPSGTALRKARSQELADLILGSIEASPIKPEVIHQVINENLSIFEDSSLYLTQGGVTVLYHDRHPLHRPGTSGADWALKKFEIAVVIDLILFQRVLLSTWNEHLDTATRDLSTLQRLRSEYVLALGEFEALDISYWKEVETIIERGQAVLRIGDLRKLFLLKLEGIESLIKVAEARRQTSRDYIIKTLTTLVATIFTLGAAQGVITVVKGWSPTLPENYPAWIGTVYHGIWVFMTLHPVRATLMLYLVVVLITVFTLWYGNIGRWWRRRRVLERRTRPMSAEQTVSPVPFTVVHEPAAQRHP